ncbi:bacillithiol system redox-active protein YtxJ [Runella sp.]|uniref:bacillithiol system redox-active protein YtxJ n=1 Tax=Runella sp. TaxID=1960881 RepID=UPI003D11E212
MNWNKLNDSAQLEEIKKESHQYPVLILKHSTRCSISSATLGRLERNWKQDEVGDLKPYFLDLIAYRSVSNQIAQEFGVEHESPQAIVIRNGESVYDTSHFDITFDAIKAQAAALV